MKLTELKKAAKTTLIGFLLVAFFLILTAFMGYVFNNFGQILLMLTQQPHEELTKIQMVAGCIPFFGFLLIILGICYKIGDSFSPFFDSEEESE